MEKIDIRKANPVAYNLKHFNDTASIARSEMILLFGKPEKRNEEMVLSLEMTIDNGDCIKIIPFELRIPKIVGDIYHYSKSKIYTTNKDFSQRIKAELTNSIADLRKRNREP